MKKKTLWKDIRKSITHSWGRFFSIMMLMALGSFALVGLLVTGPDMRTTGENYFNQLNSADITIISDYGIDESERDYIEKANGIKDIEYVYLKDVVVSDDINTSFRICSKPHKISFYEMIEGRLPEEDNEIAIDEYYRKNYSIGDTISFTEKADENGNETLKIHDFKVVGYIKSGEILSNLNRGQTTAGSGELSSFGIVNENVFDSEVYMMAKVTFEDTMGVDPYSDEYTNLISAHKEELSELLRDQQDIRLASIKSEYQAEIDDGQVKIDDAKKELEDARIALNDAQIQINDAKIQIEENESKLADANQKIKNAEKEIKSNEATLIDKQSEYNSKMTEFSQKKSEYETATSYLAGKQSEYDSKSAELIQKQSEYEAKVNELVQKQNELDEGKKQLKASQEEVNSKYVALESGKKQYEDGIATLSQAISGLETALTNPSITEEERLGLQQELEIYRIQLEQTNSEYNIFMTNTYTPSITALQEAQNQINAKQLEIMEAENAINQAAETLNVAKTQLDNGNSQLASAKTQLDEGNNQLSSAKGQLDSGSSQLSSAKAQLDDGNSKLIDAKSQLANSKKEYASNLKKLEDAKVELASKEQEYNEKLAEFQEKEPDALKEISENEEKLNDAREDLAELELPTYSVDSRREIPGGEGYKIYGTVAEIVDDLAKIFPIFLYFVAALVTLNTMTRFVSEERINSGTLKALGYSDLDIIQKFTIYGFVAGMTGTILGIILGHTLLPYIVYNAYQTGFTLPEIELHFYPKVTAVAIVLSLISSVIPAHIVAKKELQEKPASLLLPKAPKVGSKIFLEHIKPIWNRMSFTHKVTARNIFRYKQRMFMTIFGVAGAASLLYTGFSVQASLSSINEKQFEEIIRYDMIVATNDHLKDEEQNELTNLLNSDAVSSYSSVYYEDVSKVAGDKQDRQEIRLIVPEKEDDFEKYINLRNRESGEKIHLTDDGVVISERLSDLLNVQKGDTITVTDSKDVEREMKVIDICEMYTGHFIFMNTKTYENIYQKTLVTNANFVLLKDDSIENTRTEASKFMELLAVKGVVQNTTLHNQIETIVQSLDQIMTVLILVAAMLAVVILYNLTNINVSERIRELSTIKVLGFYDHEVTMYIYRETIVLSLVGIIVGWLLGILLHSYILAVVPPDEVMFDPARWIGAYIIPFITITVVSFILKFYVNHKLKNVDMLEALKSVD